MAASTQLRTAPRRTPCRPCLLPRNVVAGVAALFVFQAAASSADDGVTAATGVGPQADENRGEAAAAATAPDLESIARHLRRSLVTVAQEGRDGTLAGSGAGFLVSDDGLVATCLHVVGEARRLHVTTSDGGSREVTEVFAHDRKADLAILRVSPAEGLPALELALDTPVQGQRVAAMGNPHGLDYSLVEGLVSAVRDEGLAGLTVGPVVQLSIPIEPGNSGGPVVDHAGNVLGVIAIKSLQAENLGFAVPAARVRDLLDDPNPIPFERWLTIGALDPSRWTATMGSDWRQRAGRIHVAEPGRGFGGRSLCLWQSPPDGDEYEAAVTVELDDESGAAGLAFAWDGGDRHYGFYPSGGQLRLTYFGGPSVYDWEILQQIETPAYRPGEPNRLRVRVTGDSITGFINGTEVTVVHDARLRGGHAGLAKFRDTAATFRRFRLGDDLSEPAPPDPATDLVPLLEALAATGPGGTASGSGAVADHLPDEPAAATRLLELAARGLEDAAAQARELAADIRVRQAVASIENALASDPPNLAAAALHVAAIDNEEIDVGAYLDEVDRLGSGAREALERARDSGDPAAALNRFLFQENGFHGSRYDYGNPSNSYLNELIDDREGLPITLAVLYLEVARRAGVPHLVGLGLPGHFVVAEQNTDSTTAASTPYSRFIDVFDRGSFLTEAEADAIVRAYDPASGGAADFAPSTPRQTVTRMLVNLREGAVGQESWPEARAYAEAIASLNPDDASARLSLAILSWQCGRADRAVEQFQWIHDNRPPGVDLDRVAEFLQRLRTEATDTEGADEAPEPPASETGR